MYIKNNDTVTHVWVGRTYTPGEYRFIEAGQRERTANDGLLLKDIANSLAVVATNNTGSGDILDWNRGINELKSLPTPLIPDYTESYFTEVESEAESLSTGVVIPSGQSVGIGRFKGISIAPNSYIMLVYDRGGGSEKTLGIIKNEDEILFDHTATTNQITGNGTSSIQIILVNNDNQSSALGGLFEAYKV